MFELTFALYRKLGRAGTIAAPFVLLLIRLAWGWELVESGFGHLTHLDQTTQFFATLNIPAPHANAILSGVTELAGGALWMLGLGARVISLPLLINFCVAYLTASRDKVLQLFTQDPSNFIDDTAFPFLVTSLLMIAFGAGAISIDALIKRWMARRVPAAELDMPARRSLAVA
jgi:putative oxidoreductase